LTPQRKRARANSLSLSAISNTVLKLMDETDVILSSILLVNSRTPYRELAEKLNLSANAVHKRIQSLIDLGIIRKFTAKVSLAASQAIIVILYGRSEAESVNNLQEKLGKNGSIWWVTLGGGNYIVSGAYVKSMMEIEALVDYVKKEALMPNPTVGIFPIQTNPAEINLEKTLRPLDRQIICALSNDSRKPIATIADEVGVTAKTVRRRLSTMVSKGLIEFSIHWYPDASNDIMTTMQVKIKPTTDKNAVASILKTYFPNLVTYFQFVNIPNELFCIAWTNTMKQLKEIQQRLTNEESVASVVSNILYTGYIFDTWRDELVCPEHSPTNKGRN
jgi:DNA-binding Lrp family transcriptional regulator